PAWVGVSVLAARWRKWRARDYLALVPPRRGEIAFGALSIAVLLIASDLLTLLIGREVVPGFMREAYLSARNSGSLALFFLAVVIVAPISEEIAFRGFLFRGLSASWLGVCGAIIATSAAWAAMHVQYDSFTLAQIFCIGLLLGWIRWASGSTLLTIMLHMLANLTACIQAAIKVEWLG
ncbi:MAG: CPBP family intramembrane metalloprotease, partial [Deltaproteobacteria bacterium]